MNVPREPILNSEKWRRIIFFCALRGWIRATHLYALPSEWQRGIGTEPPFSKSWIRHWPGSATYMHAALSLCTESTDCTFDMLKRWRQINYSHLLVKVWLGQHTFVLQDTRVWSMAPLQFRRYKPKLTLYHHTKISVWKALLYTQNVYLPQTGSVQAVFFFLLLLCLASKNYVLNAERS